MKQLLMALVVFLTAANALGADREIEALYKKSCFACHAYGANNAPRTGVTEQWAPHMEKGMETLVKHVREGYNTMPPMGLCFDCSDAEFKALIQYMAVPQP